VIDENSFRASLLPALEQVDRVVHELDLAPTAIDIITRKWSGGRKRVGVAGDTVLPLPRWTVVAEVSNREVAQSGGRFTMGDLRVGPIRPHFKGNACLIYNGGFTIDQLRPTVTDESTEIIYRARQEHGMGTGWSGDYYLVELTRDDPLEFYAVIRRLMETNNKVQPLDP
jgi:hypothetical protein